jgi:hypothetical protein
MLCIVTPLGDLSPTEMAGRLADCARRKQLRALLIEHGSIHYATFTLVPPSPEGTSQPSGAALALLLAVDEDLSPAEVLSRLVALGLPVLSTLYEGTIQAVDASSLLGLLKDKNHLHPATGGFVGARDRSVSQIRAESGLVTNLRYRVLPGVLRGSEATPLQSDARTLAAELSERVLADPDFAWAARPAPRSKWRNTVTSAPQRLAATAGYLVLVAMLVVMLATLALSGFLNQLAVAFLNPHFVGLASEQTFAQTLTEGLWIGQWLRALAFVLVLLIIVSGLIARLQGLQVLAFELVLVMAVIVTVGLALAPVVALWFGNAKELQVELWVAFKHIVIGFFVFAALGVFLIMLLLAGIAGILLTPPWSSRARLVTTTLCCALAGLFIVHLLLVLVLEIGAAFDWKGWSDLVDPGGRPWYFGLIIDRIAIIVIAVAAVMAGLLYLLARTLRSALSGILTPLNAPRPPRPGAPYNRLHQTNPSIDACEAELVGRTAFMASVTEIRRPYWFHANAARFFLWLISSLGWHYYSEGRLGSVSSIQFAHWHVIDRGRRLLFCANFDGDFGGYLDEFITGQVPLINVIWRWTQLGVRPGLCLGDPLKDAPATRARRFPRTRLWLFSGCRSEQQFKAFARDSMLPFQFHFAAYERSLGAILRATELRDAIGGERGLVADDIVLRTLET